MSESQPEWVGEVFIKLLRIFGKYNVILAGGACRDFLLDREIKDYP